MHGDISPPKVTVLMTVHNGARHIREAVDSILNQTWQDFEFLIVNDGSTDDSAAILDTYNDVRIRVIQLDWSGGAHALNHGLSLARGEYVANIDHDDQSLPKRLESQVRFLDEHPHVAVVGTACEVLNEELHTTTHKFLETEDQQIRRELLRSNPLVHSSAMYRRESICEIGGFNSDLKLMYDYDLWSRVAVNRQLANLPEILAIKRVHAGQFYRTQFGFRDRFVASAKIRWQIWRRHSGKPWDLRFVLLPLLMLMARGLFRRLPGQRNAR